ncbi:DUF5996 family protein [Rhodocytophaga aerolata]|uniref:DUF5996 family protein n=1 Tax=Rhodocytophaga aerolata TaxID=455078 RepID=A0ABT8RIB2_9BACT|nr:DUF5996 family protein [Rhodocytophaga aerolata]MDO1451847.1 DUF5996 family protein [Rhodocytophaga aerolata]
MALLTYNDLVNTDDPRAALLDFLESAYRDSAKKANWDIETLTVPELSNI